MAVRVNQLTKVHTENIQKHQWYDVNDVNNNKNLNLLTATKSKSGQNQDLNILLMLSVY